MSADSGLVPTRAAVALVNKEEKKRPVITEQDAIPLPEVEVVTEEEVRHEEQLRSKASPPEVFFHKAPEGAPGVVGADVNSESLLGFLAAAEFIVGTKDQEVLSSVKVTYRPGDDPRLYLESSGTGIWGIVALKASSQSSEGFVAMMPLLHARNAVNSTSLDYKTTTVGVHEERLCLGPTMIPFGGRVDGFPTQPVLRDWDARAVVPATYFEELCSKVIPAQADPTQEGFKGVLLDFDVCEVEGQNTVVCVAVATNGGRMHLMQLPRMKIETKVPGILPPAVLLPGRFLRYLSAVADGEWTALEISEEQVVAKGKDYFVVADATMPGKGNLGVDSWRSVNPEYEGSWTVDSNGLARLAKASAKASGDGSVRIRIDSMSETLEICSWGSDGHKFKDRISAKRFGGPPAVQVNVDVEYLIDAITACKSGLIHLGFVHDLEDQWVKPMTVQTTEGQFKSIIMPVTK